MKGSICELLRSELVAFQKCCLRSAFERNEERGFGRPCTRDGGCTVEEDDEDEDEDKDEVEDEDQEDEEKWILSRGGNSKEIDYDQTKRNFTRKEDTDALALGMAAIR